MKTIFMHVIRGRRGIPALRFKPSASLRFLPALIFFGSLLLTLKIGLIWRDTGSLVSGGGLAVAGALARSTGEAAAPPVHDAPEAPSPRRVDGGNAAHASPDKPEAQSKNAAAPSQHDAPAFTPGEVDVLRQLAKRREQLDARAGELDKRAAMMRAAESRIDAKVAALKDLQERVSASIRTHDAEQDAKLASLTKLYEAMKPKDAAAIFEALDLETLLLVAERMKERKLAPIMAEMKPTKARDVTIQLVKLRQIDLGGRSTATSRSGSGQ